YLGDPNAGGQPLGAATYGQARPDVARTLGDARFTNSGFQLAVELPAGQHEIYVYAHRNTAASEDGWAVTSVSFTASTSVRPDAQAAALLGGDQPQVRTAAPQTTTTTPSRAPGLPPASVTGPGSAPEGLGTAMRFVGSRDDPIPLEPSVPGMATAQGTGANGPELADPTGSGSGIRVSAASDPSA